VIKTSNYGKSRVRLVKVEREGPVHQLRELNVHIQFTGDYDECYVSGDNSRILPTDTMKNTVYALARKAPLGAVEDFGKRLCDHFLAHNPHLRSVRVEIEEANWLRLGNHSFQQGAEVRTAVVVDGTSFRSGLKDLVLLNTTDSSFEGYVRDPYTTLKEAKERIMATAVEARWKYADGDLDFHSLWNTTWTAIRARLIEVFVGHVSPSVQSTLYAMGEAVLAGFPAVEEITLSLPNKHCLLVNLEPFGMDNPNEVFVPVDEPHGLIEATLCRGAK
jgi:urate oxidase